MKGIVADHQVAGLVEELIVKLTNVKDEELQQVAMQTIYDSKVVYKGSHYDAGPDLIPGYAVGYCLSCSAAFYTGNPGSKDLAPTVPQLFGVAPLAWIKGKPLIPAV